MLKCGLLGEKLSHSYSPQIHSFLGNYEYKLYEKSADELYDFLKNGDFDGLNVTIPYKKTVIDYIDELSEISKKIGSVNTIVKLPDGRLYGDITDYYGFCELVRHSGIDVSNKKTLVLGSGGAAMAVVEGLKSLNAFPVVISRTGKFNYDNISLNYDAEVIVNTTPIGMYPKNGDSIVDLEKFPALTGVIDIIYNPSKTNLLLQAEKLGLKFENGLYMLVCQAKKSSEIFTNSVISDDIVKNVYNNINYNLQNIILIGMPGSGKTTVAERIAVMTNREFFDSDQEVIKRWGKTPSEIIKSEGEAQFRQLETQILSDLSKLSGKVISTGGGVVTVPMNMELLRQNSVIVWLERDLEKLAKDDRPLTEKFGVSKLYEKRKDLYKLFCDISVTVDDDFNITSNAVLDSVKSYFGV